MHKMYFVSIIVPVYNVEQYILDCLESVKSQDFDGKVECLVVDDCGTDSSMSLVRQFIDDYTGNVDFSILTRSSNGGLSAARNTGLDNAKGDYVLFLDSDDELTPKALTSLVNAAEKDAADFIIGEYIPSVSNLPYPKNYLPGGTVLVGSQVSASYCRREWYMMAWNKLYRRSFLEEASLRFREGILHEDELWSFQCAMRAHTVGIIDAVTYVYRIREGSIMTADAKSAMRRAASYGEIVCGISDEVAQTQSCTVDVHIFLQYWLVKYLRQAMNSVSDSESRRVYNSVRGNLAGIPIPPGRPFARRVKDLHMALSPNLGYKLLRFELKFLK